MKYQQATPILSDIDKKILKSLLSSNCRVSSLSLSKSLEIPLTTVQRRRKRLESEFLTITHQMKLEKLGWRHAQLLISTINGSATTIGRLLLSECPEVVSVNRSIGEHTIDLLAEIVFKDNKELVRLIDKIKGMEGVKDVAWSEIVEEIRRNNSDQAPIVDML